ncbi:MAG: hypothetical protein ACRDRA_10915 [Pseudonocardiaceae bacterium]
MVALLDALETKALVAHHPHPENRRQRARTHRSNSKIIHLTRDNPTISAEAPRAINVILSALQTSGLSGPNVAQAHRRDHHCHRER